MPTKEQIKQLYDYALSKGKLITDLTQEDIDKVISWHQKQQIINFE